MSDFFARPEFDQPEFLLQFLSRPYLLKGKVQHYAWGGYRFIPELLGENPQEGKPYAEYWMGAHPSAPALLFTQDNQEFSLGDYLSRYPQVLLGKEVSDKFGGLPFLFKVLDVREMLSIQVHPTLQEAALGFDREEAEGIPLQAAHRNYKDRNHKPEVMVALSSFWLLHGFRKKKEIRAVLERNSSWHKLLPILEQHGISGLYQHIMLASAEEIDQWLQPVCAEIYPLYQRNLLSKKDPAFWAARAVEQYSNGKFTQLDRGIFSIYFFNLVELQPGEAIFQGAGIPHAYLEGQNMELMANSDNVLRGGLTPKHIDVPELMKHISFEEVTPNILKGISLGAGIQSFPCPVDDFSIRMLNAMPSTQLTVETTSAEIWLVLEGQLKIQIVNSSVGLTLQKGEACFLPAGASLQVFSKPGATAFMAAPGSA